jgi:hypothetical protein
MVADGFNTNESAVGTNSDMVAIRAIFCILFSMMCLRSSIYSDVCCVLCLKDGRSDS